MTIFDVSPEALDRMDQEKYLRNPNTSSLNFTFTGNEPNSVMRAQMLLTKLEFNFRLQSELGKDVTDTYMICMALNCLNGSALNWFSYRFKEGNLTWAEFKKEFTGRYCPTTDFEARQCSARYNACVQGRNKVDKYVKDFEELRSFLAYDYESEEAMRDRFIRGLTPKIQSEVYQRRPDDYNAAKFLAKSIGAGFRPLDSGYFPEDTRGEPMDIDSLQRGRYNNRQGTRYNKQNRFDNRRGYYEDQNVRGQRNSNYNYDSPNNRNSNYNNDRNHYNNDRNYYNNNRNRGSYNRGYNNSNYSSNTTRFGNNNVEEYQEYRDEYREDDERNQYFHEDQ